MPVCLLQSTGPCETKIHSLYSHQKVRFHHLFIISMINAEDLKNTWAKKKKKQGEVLSLEHGDKSTQLRGGGCWYGKDALLLEKGDKYSCTWRKGQILLLIYNGQEYAASFWRGWQGGSQAPSSKLHSWTKAHISELRLLKKNPEKYRQSEVPRKSGLLSKGRLPSPPGYIHKLFQFTTLRKPTHAS